MGSETPGDRERRKLTVDMTELEAAFQNRGFDSVSYLDLETGAVILLTSDDRNVVERIYEEAPEGEEVDFLEALNARDDVPNWQKSSVIDAHRIECGSPGRYLEIPHDESWQNYRDMQDFISTVADDRLRDRLLRAIDGRGAFRRFRDVLGGQRLERDRWHRFEAEALRRRILDWLEWQGIDA